LQALLKLIFACPNWRGVRHMLAVVDKFEVVKKK
jgi:hypothetical protein